MQENFVEGELGGTDSEGGASEQKESFRYHTDNGGYHGLNAGFWTSTIEKELLREKDDADGDDDKTNDFDDLIKGANDFGLLGVFDSFSFKS